MTPPPKKKAVTLTSDEDSTSSDEDMFADADAMKSQSDDQVVKKLPVEVFMFTLRHFHSVTLPC